MLKNSWKISVVVDNDSWIFPYCEGLVRDLSKDGHEANLCRNYKEVGNGDIAFYLGCVRITPKDVLNKNKINLVVHESDLPRGRGFAPVAWQILEGQNTIPIVLFEARTEADSGPVFLKDKIVLMGHELMNDIRVLQGKKTVSLCRDFVRRYPNLKGAEQKGQSTAYSRRRPANSKLDIDKTLREQFSLLRTVDNERFPAYFDINGYRYTIRIEKKEEIDNFQRNDKR